MKDKNNGETRRSILKNTAIGATALSALPVVQAKEQPTSRDIFEQALRVQEKTGDRTKYRKFLENRGWSVASKDMTLEIPVSTSNEQDGVSTQKLDKADLEIGLSLTENCNENFYGKVTWNWGDNDYDDIGDDPKDNIGMSWKEDSWYVPADGAYGGKYIANVSDYDYSANGISMRYSDGNDLEVFGAGGAERWIAADLRKPSDAYDPGARQLWAVYNHCWAGGSIKSVSISFGAISATFDTSAKQWDKGTDQNGDKLILSEADASYNC